MNVRGNTGAILVFAAAILVLFAALWYGVLIHLDGWGLVLGIVALVERVFRICKMWYKRNGVTWLDM